MGTMVAPGIGTIIGAGVGALAGGVQGYLGGSAKKKAQKQADREFAALRAEQIRRGTNVGQVRDTFGVLPTAGENYRSMGATLENRGSIEGAIESQARAQQDAAGQGVNDAMQQAAAARKGQIAARGVLGGSLDESSRQSLLGTYLGAKAGTAGIAEGARSNAWSGLDQERLGLEQLAAGGGGLDQTLAGQRKVAGIQSAKQAIPYRMFGSLLGGGLDMMTQGATAEAQGGQGLGIYGIRNPNLGQRGGVGGANVSKGI